MQMTVHISSRAEKELDDMDEDLRILFMKHLRKMQSMPPRRHMKHGIPYHTEEVTKQDRIIYQIQSRDIFVIHCFKNHKEYEHWYKSYK